MSAPGTARRLLLPCALAFLSSAAIMAVEMAAGRMVALYAGAGLYTWTSVIGIVLAGMTLGGFLGGHLADRHPSRELLCVLFFAGAAASAALPVVNYGVGRLLAWDSYTSASFPARIATHVGLVFFLPAAILGTLGPVTARLALAGGGPVGSTVGTIYAFQAFGSIVGTFLSGYFLIAAIGTAGVVLVVAVVLWLEAWTLAPRQSLRLTAVTWPLLLGLAASSSLVVGRGKGRWIWKEAEGRPAIAEQGNKGGREWLFGAESQYSFLRVAEDMTGEKTRYLLMDNLLHAIYSPRDPKTLLYDYERIYHVLSLRQAAGKKGLRFFFIGGGGYVFPRHVRDVWPDAAVEVAEIDPVVTEANFEAFGLDRAEVLVHEPGLEPAPTDGAGPDGRRRMDVYHLDARNRIDELLRDKRDGSGFQPFDFVYGDAFNDYCVPYHLVTRELMEKVREILVPERGIYLMNVIDIYDSGLFLGAMYNTLRAVFPHVYIFSNRPEGPSPSPLARDTWIIAASLGPLDVADVGARPGEQSFPCSLLTPEHVAVLVGRSKGLVLTDDHAPVENLLAPVVERRAKLESRE